MRRFIAHTIPLALLAVIVTFVACNTVPDSGRRQVNLLAPKEEAALGISEFQKMKKSLKISTNSSYNAQVNKVGRTLAKVMPVPNAKWEFVVFDDKTPNAFALPGGKVGVHTGLFQITQNEAGLAAVMGHEVAHVVARHSGERVTRNALTNGAVAVGAAIIAGSTGIDPSIASNGLGAGAKFSNLRHSRQNELEADRLGALYMARAGYHPSESVKLWQRFADFNKRNGQSQGVSFLRTHPLDDTRIDALEEYLPNALAEYRQ